MNYIQLIQQLFQHPNSLIPHIIVNTIKEIDFQKLQKLGIKYIVFDRDNTLTEHKCEQYSKGRQEKEVVEQCKKRFGDDNVALLSNSILNCHKGQQLNLSLIYTPIKKPFNYSFVREHFSQGQIKPQEICFIGDRLLTDIMLANLNGSVGVLVQPINVHSETLGIRVMRGIENTYLGCLSHKTQPHTIYGSLD